MSTPETSILPSYNNSTVQITPTHEASQSAAPGRSQRSSQGAPPGSPPATISSREPSVHSEQVPDGYPSLSTEMGTFPELAVFRRFGALNAQNLLYMQAEIQEMEINLRRIQANHSSTTDVEDKWSLVNWFYLGHSKERGRVGHELELVEKIRQKLKEYNTGLIQQHQILRMAPPGRRDLRYLQDFLVPLKMAGDDSSIWGDSDEPGSGAKDLVALLSRPNEDPLSTWVSEKAVDQLLRIKCLRSRELETQWGREGCKEETLHRLAGIVTNVVASALPILSIVVLYFVEPLGARLGIIAGFNILLSICLAAFTKAKRAEVFAVTAAFSAIQVVYVQVDSKC